MFALLSAALPLVEKLVDRIPDPAAKERAKLEMQADLLAALVEESKGQAEINKVEAAHTSILWLAGVLRLVGYVLPGSRGHSCCTQCFRGSCTHLELALRYLKLTTTFSWS